MVTWRLWLMAIACLTLASGCLARQVARDGEGLRQALLVMYTDQAMDNVIRARRNEPFVQLKYRDLMVQDQDKMTASATGETGTINSSRAFDASKAVALQRAFSRGFMGAFPIGANLERDRTLTFHADPITDQNYIYESYLAFAEDSNHLMVSCEKPACPVHIKREYCGLWYWIPPDAAEEFAALVLSTSVGAAPPQTGYWATTVDHIDFRYDESGNIIPQKYVVTFTTDVPNGDGMLLLTSGDKKFPIILEELDVIPYESDMKQTPEKSAKKNQAANGLPEEDQTGAVASGMPGPLPGAPTKVLYAQWHNDDLIKLRGVKAMVLSNEYPNSEKLGQETCKR